MNDTVFIGLPVRNGAAHLRAALDSVLSQQHRNWILLVSDNQSTDETAEIVAQYARSDSRILLRHQASDIGPIDNFITCARACPDDVPYFAWFAHDDVWQPEFLSALVGLLERDPTASYAWTNVYSLDSFGQYQGVPADYSRYFGVEPWPALRYVMEHETCGKAMLIYSVFRRPLMRASLDAVPSDYRDPNWDNVFNLACISRGQLTLDRRHLFGKRAPRPIDALGVYERWRISFNRRLGLSGRAWNAYFSAMRAVVDDTRHEMILKALVTWRRYSKHYVVPYEALRSSDIVIDR